MVAIARLPIPSRGAGQPGWNPCSSEGVCKEDGDAGATGKAEDDGGHRVVDEGRLGRLEGDGVAQQAGAPQLRVDHTHHLGHCLGLTSIQYLAHHLCEEGSPVASSFIGVGKRDHVFVEDILRHLKGPLVGLLCREGDVDPKGGNAKVKTINSRSTGVKTKGCRIGPVP